MKCPKCATENADNAKFCKKCGQALRIDLVCPRCHHQNTQDSEFCVECGLPLGTPQTAQPQPGPPHSSVPASFANGRYQVKKFLGEGGKKKVYLAHDTVLDRDVAFALIKTEKLDETARTRIKREAQAMGRLGDHPNIVTVFDFGDHEGQPYMVLPLLSGGDVEGLIKKAPDHKLPLDQSIEIARSVCKGLQFAHAKGIIHRDIKPGNVWMSADGTAKVGDFGLAVAVDLSRLTQAGMMVGTVSYMPPEQAMGGKVTAKADLYSLGAMLYEMVTGRPPFIGDDSVAIIGQHINTAPVSPSWHRADLPPALETLIMQLLEKDPEKRPASATVVLQALDSIGAGKVGKEPSKEAAVPTENPLYRRVFVGRKPELKQLQSAFDGAMSGQGSLMMVLGEPGIGKTALCEQLSSYVTLRGGRTLVGHCYEEGSLSLPYLAFVEAMRSYVLDREVAALRKELGTGAADIARIVSEIRERLKVRLKPQKDPEEERYRLMQAVAGFLTNAASVQPMLVVLEDLHDADRGTLDMLTHVSRNLAGARLLVVGTYRDVEVDRTHPLSAALAELRRMSSFGRVALRGLNADEVRRMLESITRESVPWGMAEAVQRQTEGNPLFVQEVVRFLAEEGLISREQGRWRPTKDTPLEMSIPEGLRDVIGKRLSLLSKECNQLLSVASVIGREFAVETLRAVANMNEDVFVSALKDAVRLSVLEERSQVGQVRYRFTHAFFRQTLYEEMIAPQRLRLHQQVARALETLYAKRLEEHAAELAEHFSQSTDTADLKKAVEYGELAAKRAIGVYAYGEAARLLDQALKVQRVLAADDKPKICDLLLDLCDALLNAVETKRILDVETPEAFSLAESIGDSSRASRVCRVALDAIVVVQAFPGFATPEWSRWAARADRYAKPDTSERAYADFALGCMKGWTGDMKSGRKHLIQALDLARRLGDWDIFWWAGAILMSNATSAPQLTDEKLRLAEELMASPRPELNVRNAEPLVEGLLWTGSAFFAAGQRKRAEEAWSELAKMSRHTGHMYAWLLATAAEVLPAFLDGRLVEGVDMTESLRTHAKELGFGEHADIPGDAFTFAAYWYLGGTEALERILSRPQRDATRGVTLAHLGRKEEAWRILDRRVVERPGIGTSEDETPATADALYLEASVMTGHREAATLLMERFRGTALCFTQMYSKCIPRQLGGAAALLGRYDEARAHYDEAIKVCAEMGFRPELALSRLQLAELLLEHFPDEKKEAVDHLDFVIKEFREMKMQPSLERALRRKEILKA